MDGGYYLCGLRLMNNVVFQLKAWSTNTVLEESIAYDYLVIATGSSYSSPIKPSETDANKLQNLLLQTTENIDNRIKELSNSIKILNFSKILIELLLARELIRGITDAILRVSKIVAKKDKTRIYFKVFFCFLSKISRVNLKIFNIINLNFSFNF